jgi:hypothetical protein
MPGMPLKRRALLHESGLTTEWHATAQRRTMSWLDKPIWRRLPFAEGWEDHQPDAVVWISIVALDMAWKISDDYVGAAGSGSLHDDRYAKVGGWIAGAVVVDVPVVCVDENEVPCFTDGRHRFALLRDHGLESLPIQVPSDQADFFESRFGAIERVGSVL